MDILSFIIGVVAAAVVCTAIVFLTDKGPKAGPVIVGTLYVHESDERETYSFAFDFPLEEIKNRDVVMLNVSRHKAKAVEKLIEDMENA